MTIHSPVRVPGLDRAERGSGPAFPAAPADRNVTGGLVMIEVVVVVLLAVLALGWAIWLVLLTVVLGVAFLWTLTPTDDEHSAAARLVRRTRLRQRQRAARQRRGRTAFRRRAEALGLAAVVADLAPSLSIKTIEGPGGPIGVGQDNDGWFAVVDALPLEGMRGDRAPALDLGALARMLTDTQLPVSRIQLVLSYQPAPIQAEPRSTAAASYGELVGGAAVAAWQHCWIATRITSTDAAGEFDDAADTERALAFSVDRATRTLSRMGAHPRTLDGEGMLRALTRSCVPTSAQTGRQVVRERWSSLVVGRLAHACFWVSRWPSRVDPAALDLLASAAGVPSTVAMILTPDGPDHVSFRCLIRLSADVDLLRSAVGRLTSGARRANLGLRRLNGDQAVGVYATAPTGGGAL
jgi:type VII secretion protein EccE